MLTATIGQVRATLADFVDRVAHQRERVVITRHGKPEAVLVSVADLERIARMLRIEKQVDALIARAAFEDMRNHGYMSWDEISSVLNIPQVAERTHDKEDEAELMSSLARNQLLIK
jgi:prevent-host-death family protein